MMKRVIVLVAVVLSFVFLPVVATAEGNVFEDALVGFKIVKPDSWAFIVKGDIGKAKASARLSDAELEELLSTRGGKIQLVTIDKESAKHNDLTPAVHVGFFPLGPYIDTPVTEILDQIINGVAPPEGAVIENKAIEASIDGMKGAYIKVSYLEEVSNMWLVKRGGFGFMVLATWPEPKTDSLKDDFAEIIASIEIKK